MSTASRLLQLWKPATVALIVALLLPSDLSEVLKLSMRAGGRTPAFWLGQAVALVLLAGFTYLINTVWDRYADATATKVIGWIIDMLIWLGTPIVRLAVRIAKLVWHRLPPSLREPEGQWQALLLTAWIATSLSLLVQHLHNARDAADQKALHRSELPQLASGVLHWNWKGACIRPQDGVLPMQLAALPLRLGTLRLSTAEAAGGWTPRTGPPPQSWAAAGASQPPERCGGGASDLWRMGRALLLPRPGAEEVAGGAERMAVDHAGAAALLRQGRAWRLWLVAAPLQLVCAAAAYALWGRLGSLLSQLLATFCPTMLAHAPLLTVDAPACMLLHAALWAWWRLLHVSSPHSVCAAALATGLLLCCGPIAWLLPPAVAVLATLRLVSSRPTRCLLLLPGFRRRGEVGWRLVLRRRGSRLLWQLLLLPIVLLPAASLAALAHSPAPGAGMGAGLSAGVGAGVGATCDAAWQREWSRAISALQRPLQDDLDDDKASKASKRQVAPASWADAAHAAVAEGSAAPVVVVAALAAAEQGWSCSLLLPLVQQAQWWRRVLRGPPGCGAATTATAARTRRGGKGDGALSWWTGGDGDDPERAREPPLSYRSGTFGLRGECFAAQPERAWHGWAFLLKTPPTVLYLLLLLLLRAIFTPLSIATVRIARRTGVAALLEAARRRLVAALPARRQMTPRQLEVQRALSALIQRQGRQLPPLEAAAALEAAAEDLVKGIDVVKAPPADGATTAAPAAAAAASSSASATTAAQAAATPTPEAVEETDHERLARWRGGAASALYLAAPAWSVPLLYCVVLACDPPAALAHRFLLPLYPALYILIGGIGATGAAPTAAPPAASPEPTGQRDTGSATAAATAAAAEPPPPSLAQLLLLVLLLLPLCLLHLVESVAAHPDYLAYFAPLAGGSAHGHFHLLGASLDEGQDLPALAAVLRTIGADNPNYRGEPTHLAYCGEASVAAHGLRVSRLPTSSEPCPFWREPLLPPAPPPEPAAPEGVSLLDGSDGSTGEDNATAADAPPIDGAAALAGDATGHATDDDAMQMREADGGEFWSGGAAVAAADSAELRPGLYCVDANMLQGAANRFKGPWSTEYEAGYRQLRAAGRLLEPKAAGLRFARLCAFLRRTPPLASAGHTILVWRLSHADLLEALEHDAAELVPSNALSPALRQQQRRALKELGVSGGWPSPSAPKTK